MNRINRVTIVGGGTAGWLSAAMLGTFLNERRSGPPVEIELIESPRVPTIGVGEATVPGMRSLLERIGLDETQFLLRCNASFKYAVRFDGWNINGPATGKSFYHPFDGPGYVRGKDPAYHFHRFGRVEGKTDLVDSVLANVALVEACRAPRQEGGKAFEGALRYSYHLDAALFAKYLKEVTLARGVRHIVDDVVDVTQDERGYIKSLTLEQGGDHPVEFVVDCTGFHSRILGEALGEPVESWGRQLLCDRALAIQIPHIDQKSLRPCTTATALGAGWVWNLPLFNRVGTGYVYSSTHRTDDEARDEFVSHLESKGYTVDGEPRVIRMNVGRRPRSWVRNCVGIGLSAGFVEPLEATSIHTISASLRLLAANFPDAEISDPLIRRFNRLSGELYDNILEFIVMHYVTADREEPFWLAARNEIDVPDRLAENLALWRHMLPSEPDITGMQLFSHWSFLGILYAKGYFEDVEFPLEGSVNAEDWRSYYNHVQQQKKNFVAALPDHYTFLNNLRGNAARQLFGGASATG